MAAHPCAALVSVVYGLSFMDRHSIKSGIIHRLPDLMKRLGGLMNLLDYFVLQRLQVTGLHAELLRVAQSPSAQEAKVEFNLTPRLVNSDMAQALPAYQITARLSCSGGSDAESVPMFSASVAFETVYQQITGDPIDLAQFTRFHASLTRQLYPLLQHELRVLLVRLGLEKIHLPFDLATRVHATSGASVQFSGSVH